MNRELRTFVVLSLHVLINGNTIYSVLRKIDETDAFKYSGDCFDICRQSGGYQTDSSCNCKCDIESAYSVTEKRCIEPNNQIDAFRLSNSRNPALFGVTTLSLYFLQSSGFAIFYCGDNNCRYASQCKINKPRSLYDNFGWERMWLPNETEDFSIETVANRQMLKLSRTSTRYRGMLLRINIDCTVDGNTVNAFAMFGVAGEFKEKERVESRFPQTTTTSTTSMKTDSSTVSSTTIKGNTKSQNSTDKIFATGEDDGDSNAVGTALAILFVILFLIAVIIGLYLYYKWRQDKVAFVIKFNENRVVQYVQIKKSQIKQKLHHDKENMYDNPRDLYTDTQSQLSIDVLPDVVTVAERQSSPQVEKSHDNKFGTLRGLYATIDKFIRGKGKSSKKDQSFSAFPKELYNEPGVIFKIEKPKKPNRVNVKNIPFNKSKSVDEERQERRPTNTRSRSASLPPVQQNLKGVKPRPISLILSGNINQGFDGNSELINSNFYMNTPVGSQNCLIYQNEDTISIEEVKAFPNNNNRKRSSMALPESLHTINESAITERESDIIYKRPEEYIVMHPANNVPNKKPPSPSYAYADNIAKNRSVTDSKNEDPSSPPYAYAENVTKNQTVNGFENETPASPPYANADNVQTGHFSDDEKSNSPSYAYADIVAQKDVDEESQGYNYPENVPQKQEDDSYLVPHPENEDEGEPFYETPSYACCNDIQNTSAKDNYGYEYERPSCDDPEYILPPHLSPPNSFSENIFSNIRMSIFRDSEYGTT